MTNGTKTWYLCTGLEGDEHHVLAESPLDAAQMYLEHESVKVVPIDADKNVAIGSVTTFKLRLGPELEG